MTPRYLEQDFVEHIEEHLVQSGYSSLNPTEYDKTLCLIPSQLVEFIQKSQPKTFEKLKNQYGSETKDKLIKKLEEQVRVRDRILMSVLKSKLQN